MPLPSTIERMAHALQNIYFIIDQMERYYSHEGLCLLFLLSESGTDIDRFCSIAGTNRNELQRSKRLDSAVKDLAAAVLAVPQDQIFAYRMSRVWLTNHPFSESELRAFQSRN